MKPKLTFTERAMPFILEAIGKEINDNDIVIDSKTKIPVSDVDGNFVRASNLLGIVGSHFITNADQLDKIRKSWKKT